MYRFKKGVNFVYARLSAPGPLEAFEVTAVHKKKFQGVIIKYLLAWKFRLWFH